MDNDLLKQYILKTLKYDARCLIIQIIMQVKLDINLFRQYILKLIEVQRSMSLI